MKNKNRKSKKKTPIFNFAKNQSKSKKKLLIINNRQIDKFDFTIPVKRLIPITFD
jgi:hypothetical protein